MEIEIKINGADKGVKFICPNNKKEAKIVGLDKSDNEVKFYFPCPYIDLSNADRDSLKAEEVKREAKKIITLLKYIFDNYQYGNEEKNGYLQFQSMMWLIEDYIENGYYVEMEKISKVLSQGKINWKKTIKNNSLFFNNGNIIYREFVRDRNVTDETRLITEIYKCCLNYSIANIGFLFDVEEIDESIFNIIDDKDYINIILINELNNTFRDNKKVLIEHLLSIVNNANTQSTNSGYLVSDDRFEYVFERMIDKVFGNANVRNYYNEYYYHIGSDNQIASKLRPDTIYKKSDTEIYIIDSKYYDYGYTQKLEDLPEASSIEKQIGYNHYVSDVICKTQTAVVSSIFVLPYSSKDEKVIEYKGYANDYQDALQKKKDKDNVAICLIDLKTLVDQFLYGGIKLNSQELLNEIKKQCW